MSPDAWYTVITAGLPSIAAAAVSLMNFFKSRGLEHKSETIRILVNGAQAWQRERITQLQRVMKAHGVPIPPPTFPEPDISIRDD